VCTSTSTIAVVNAPPDISLNIPPFATSDIRALLKFDISTNNLSAAGTKLLVEALKGNTTVTELNISSNHMTGDVRGLITYGGMSGVVALADVIPDMGALTKLDISNSDIGKLVGVAVEPTGKISGKYNFGIISSTRAHDGALSIVLTNRDGQQRGNGTLNALTNEGAITLPSMGGEFAFTFDENTDTLTFSDGDKWAKKTQKIPVGVIAIANAIPDMGALSVLSLMNNSLCNREAGRALSEMLAVNTVLKELDVSENMYYDCDGVGFAQELAVGLRDNEALTRLDISKNRLFDDDGGPAGKALGEMLAVNFSLQELDVSGTARYRSSKGGPSFARALSTVISDNGSLSFLDISNNSIGELVWSSG
jgi:hypothetical protein